MDMDKPSWRAEIARAKALLATARDIVAAARNQRHTAILRRALDKQTRRKQKAA